MAHVVNVKSSAVPLEIGTHAGKGPLRFIVKPGEAVEVEDAYARPRRLNPHADPLPSIVEQLTNGAILPADDPRAQPLYQAWLDKQTEPPPARPGASAKGR